MIYKLLIVINFIEIFRFLKQSSFYDFYKINLSIDEWQ